MGGGVASAGGSTGPMAGSLTVPATVLNPKVVATADGVFHVAHRTQTPSSIVYGRCSSNCGIAQQWSFVTVEPTATFIVSPRLAVGADSRVHLVYTRTNSPAKNVYATCAANCTVAGNWTKTEFDAPTNCDWEDQGSALVLDTQGRLSFLTTDFNSRVVCLNTCGASCGTADNWQTAEIIDLRPSSRNSTLGFAGSGTTLHLVYDDLTAGLRYQRCTGNCTMPASWQRSPPLFFHGDAPVALSASPQGRLALAYNQGTTDPGAPVDVKAFDGRLAIWECTTGCDMRSGWAGVIAGAVDDGKNGLATASIAGGVVAIATQSSGTSAHLCETNCGMPASWTSADLETTATLTAALPDAYTLPGCEQNGQPVRPQLATWAPEFPAVAVSDFGLVVHTGTRGLRTCPGVSSPTIFPGYGRLLYAPP